MRKIVYAGPGTYPDMRATVTLMIAMPLQLTIGSVRAKSAKSVALKNIMDAAFGGVGYAVLQGIIYTCMHIIATSARHA